MSQWRPVPRCRICGCKHWAGQPHNWHMTDHQHDLTVMYDKMNLDRWEMLRRAQRAEARVDALLLPSCVS